MALALAASVISIRLGISVALAEIGFGVIGGTFLGLHTTPWIDFLATFGSVVLTFLAGAEIDPDALRRHLKASLSLGAVSFALPCLGAFLFALLVAHWHLRAAEIAGIALSTTSVAVVYAVMVETGLNRTDIGKLILAACFVTDFGTVLFGTISALFGLTNGIITQAHYTVLVTVVILSAVVPTLIAQSFFRPAVAPTAEASAATAKKELPVPAPQG
jgi:Kef-type K+ transport system membrane component KefB